MKKIFPILIALACLTGCNSQPEAPEKVAWKFLHAYYGHDYETSLRYADSETRADLEYTLEQMHAEGISTKDMKAMAQPVIIEVQGIIANDGSQAVCAYKLKNSDDDQNALIETLLLNKTDEGWKVSF